MPPSRQSSGDSHGRRSVSDPTILLQSIPSAVFSVDEQLCFRFANPAAEQLLSASWNVLSGRRLSDFVASHAAILALIRQVQATGTTISDYGIDLPLARGETVSVDSHLSGVPELPGHVLVVLHPCSVARRLDQQISHRRSAGRRSCSSRAWSRRTGR